MYTLTHTRICMLNYLYSSYTTIHTYMCVCMYVCVYAYTHASTYPLDHQEINQMKHITQVRLNGLRAPSGFCCTLL